MSSDSSRRGGRGPVRRRGAWAALLFAALGSAATGCAPTTVNLAADAEPARTSYAKSFDRWTRVGRGGSVADLDTPVLFAATLRSRAFQRAFAERYIAAYSITTPSERDKILERERAATEPGLSFWVRTTFHNYLWNDLKAPTGKWRVTLVDEAGVETVADSIEAIQLKDLISPLLLSEPLDPYSKLWLVRFPTLRGDGQPVVPPGARKIRLRAAGPVGQTDLIWLLN